MKHITTYGLIFLLTLTSAGCRLFDPLSLKVQEPVITSDQLHRNYGVEIELASSEISAIDVRTIPDEAYKKPLEIVKGLFDAPGEIQIERSSYQLQGQTIHSAQATWIDPLERKWIVVSEWVDGLKKDGFELVTPVLNDGNPSDRGLVKALIEALNHGGIYRPGYRSSMHITYDVSEILERGKAGNLILYFENNMMNLFSAVSPKRYGTILNRFGIPLGVNQKQLLEGLGPLARQRAGLEELRTHFLQHNNRELEIFEQRTDLYWKYRSVAWHKLLGLTSGGHTGIFEIRMADAMNAEEFEKTHLLYRAMIEKSQRIPQASFVDPWNGQGSDWTYNDVLKIDTNVASLNEIIVNQPESRFNRFIESLGLSTADYTKLGRIRGPPLFLLSNAAFEEKLNQIDLRRNISIAGSSLNMKSQPEYYEVTLPSDVIEAIGKEKLYAWLSRANDAIVADTFINADEYVKRTPPSAQMDGFVLVEESSSGLQIRISKQTNMATEIARLIMAGLASPELIQGNLDEQKLTHTPSRSLVDAVAQFKRRFYQSELTSAQTQAIERFERLFPENMHLGIIGAENLAVHSDLDRQRFLEANKNFIYRLYNLIKSPQSIQRLGGDVTLSQKYHTILKNWYSDAQYASLIRRTLLMPEVPYTAHSITPPFLIKLANLSQSSGEPKAIAIETLKSLDTGQMIEMAIAGMNEAELRSFKSALSRVSINLTQQQTRQLDDAIEKRAAGFSPFPNCDPLNWRWAQHAR